MTTKLFWAGDSTVKTNNYTTYPQTGIGQAMSLYLDDNIMLFNHAKNGRSTKSFLDESRLAPIYKCMKKGDFLFVQFGHNDSKKVDKSRFTEAYGDYQKNLVKFVNAARNRGAFPVFITPVSRRWFLDNGRLDQDIHGDYPKAMIELGEELNVPVIDLYATSTSLLESMGNEDSKELFITTDNTHLNYHGAFIFAGCIADGLKALGGVYKELLLESKEYGEQ